MSRSPAVLLTSLSALVLPVLTMPVLAAPQDYPESRRVDHVDDYHGTQVEDPYRWLEADVSDSEEVAAWVQAQNEVTGAFLEAIPQRDSIRARLESLWNYERYGMPTKVGQRYVYSKNDGLQNQSVVYVTDRLDGDARVLFDPNAWAADGTKALSGISYSPDGTYAAYGTAGAGSDWQTWRVRNIATGEDLPDEIHWVKFSSPEWTPDGRGFFYSRYDEPTEGQFTGINRFQKLFYHRLGTNQADDVLVFHRPDEPEWGFGPTVTDDARYLVITVWKGTGDKYRVFVKDLAEPYGMPVSLIDTFEAEYTFLGNDGPVFYFKTDFESPMRRVIAIDIRQPEKANWREVIPESSDTLTGVNIVNNMFVARYLRDAKTAVRLHGTDGRLIREVDFPGIGSAGGFGGKRTDTETFYSFSSFATPPAVYHYDLVTGESREIYRPTVDMNPDDYVTRQVFYESKDGTRVPMFIAHRKDLVLDGSRPTLLYGYGGFNIPLTPGFSVTRLAWMEMGGIFAMANLRGGGEYGVDWHQAGTKLRKQNVFDDFIAAAEWLIAEGYTRPERLAIQGGSNGGLLVGACMAQRPELFGAALPAVGVMDMLRFHEFTIGWAWTDDYGSSENPEEFEALRAYSPYHNLRPGTAYPATLVTTADHDDRVVPGHSFKFAAALQYAHAGEAPVLIRVETKAGHGAGKPTSKRIEEAADVWSFLVKTLDMTPMSRPGS